MRSRFIDFEAAEDGGGDLAGGETDVQTEQTDDWSPPGREWYGNIDQFIQQAGPILQQVGQTLSQQNVAQPEYEEYGQYAEPTYIDGETDPVEYVNQLVEARVASVLEGYEPILGLVAQREAENATREALASLEGEIGSFNHDQAVFISLGLQNQGLDPEQALRIAASRQREFEEGIRNSAVEEYKASLQRTSEAVATQPGSTTGAGTEIEPTPTGPDKYTVLAERWVREQ